MRIGKQFLETLALSLFLGMAGFAMTGCEDDAFEDAGEELDDAADDIGDAADEAGDEIEDAVDDARD